MLPNPYIPDDWTPEQALAVYEFLDQLQDRVWHHYRQHIQEQCHADYCEENDDEQLDLFELNDEIPF